MERHRIISSERLAEDITRFEVVAARPAHYGRPGQFVIVRLEEDGQRIPIALYASHPDRGTIGLVVQRVGATTHRLCAMTARQTLADVVGPLGQPTKIDNAGEAVVVAGGAGAAIALPVARALRDAGTGVTAILGARGVKHVILEREFSAASDRLEVLTDDGTHGRVTEALESVLAESNIDLVHAVGSISMMQAVAEITRPHGVRTVVSLNPIMVDGTGMCGGCRVDVDGQTRFACIDGPEFDGHLIDFDALAIRNRSYAESVAFAEDARG